MQNGIESKSELNEVKRLEIFSFLVVFKFHSRLDPSLSLYSLSSFSKCVLRFSLISIRCLRSLSNRSNFLAQHSRSSLCLVSKSTRRVESIIKC
ncbi:hypothetical protein BpHYR1_044782 [Brachionus plicatilis]|uniref:Uncharacterized protein n=1 Tax=Brachionus plicatilis TaxID=10195 RepID=A0A3M7R845_BRAPC|nr:hypothetical protein BpHYR1_044782 [Brachionus plicatilis]